MIYNIESYLHITKYTYSTIKEDSEDEARDLLDDELEEFARKHDMCLLSYDIEKIEEENE